jgi:hypothetical protein
MRVHRGYLFWGVFFVLLGGIPLADRLGVIDSRQVDDAGRLWPLIIIAIGLALVLSRSRIALLATVAAAAVLGIICGSMLAWSSGWMFGLGDCAPAEASQMQRTAQSGTFSGPATVELVPGCGELTVTTNPGSTWTVDAAHRGGPPTRSVSGTNLSVRSADGGGRQEWVVSLPAALLGSLDVTANAGQAAIDVSGTTLSRLDLAINAGEAIVTANGTSIADLDVNVNAARARLTLGGPVAGDLEVNAGSIDLCVPPDAALRFTVGDDFAFDTNLDERGLTETATQDDDEAVWQRPGAGGPTITLSVDGNAATFRLDPAGGCS